MKKVLRLLASSLALVTSGFTALHAANAPAALPVISISHVDARDAGIYATQIAAMNAVMKTKAGVDPFLQLYLGDAAGADSGTVFAVSRADSFAAINKAVRVYQTDPDLAVQRTSLNAVRELGPRTLLKAARFDGGHSNAWLYNTYATVNDEPGYLNALGELTALLKGHGFEDVKINVYRVIAGRTDYTHLVSLNLPTAERLAALLDSIASDGWAIDWIAASAKFRTVVRNGTYQEITR
jgi:hypothetical protein